MQVIDVCQSGSKGFLSVDSCWDGGKHENKKEVETKQSQWGCLFGLCEVIQESNIRNDAECKQVLGYGF